AETSLCGFGTTAANPVRTALRYYRDELEAHRHGRCPGGVCRALITYRINDRCTGCTLCAKKCPEEAITGEKKELHVIDVERCTRCGLCFEVCRFDAVEVS
ncbi:MAG: 4Fe-4S binding protein, partial [Deltaproteobacteria bacterium]|nr:4Fe-4S binding protein [Deltaproteobacteria bacterium]